MMNESTHYAFDPRNDQRKRRRSAGHAKLALKVFSIMYPGVRSESRPPDMLEGANTITTSGPT